MIDRPQQHMEEKLPRAAEVTPRFDLLLEEGAYDV